MTVQLPQKALLITQLPLPDFHHYHRSNEEDFFFIAPSAGTLESLWEPDSNPSITPDSSTATKPQTSQIKEEFTDDSGATAPMLTLKMLTVAMSTKC
ncbi:hypothetical protein DSO57_1028206 [Entomophthora muscae]|uniref:Uncharacterized protein n=1 Tax=Entomophthora muscae TaxID=34485 RepID=A0ACC2T1J9_9FUNG|nr:hypothetical protein DSO57_1028206 [Entomophthora muscae]